MSLKLIGVLVFSNLILASASFAGDSCPSEKGSEPASRTPQSDVQKDSVRKPDSAAQEEKSEVVESVDQLVNRPPSWSRH